MTYDDLKEYGSEASVKAAGKLRQQGKPYESTSSSLLSLMLPKAHLSSVIDGDIAYWKAGG
jgi:obg-like ATPase 1